MFNIFKNKDGATQADKILAIAASLKTRIEDNKDKLRTELIKYESDETIEDEVWRSIDYLENIKKEIEWLSAGKVKNMCTFFPVNLPLYSLVLFAIIPGFMSEETVVRVPLLMRDLIKNIWEILDLKSLVPHLKFVDIDRALFTEAYVSTADVVLFTGRYKNAKIIEAACPKALFIYNGAGINPLVVTETAELDIAVEKAIEMRVFNSGQDCAGPDVMFISSQVLTEFADKLINGLKKVKVGNYSSEGVRVGPVVKKDQIEVTKSFLELNKDKIVYGGKIDTEIGLVEPTVVIDDLDNLDINKMTEFFSPVFYLISYKSNADLQKYFSSDNYADYAMYVSVFGSNKEPVEFPNTIVLFNKIVNDVERGYTAYGGFGRKANFVHLNNHYEYRPVLISQEIYRYLKQRDSIL